MEHYAITITRQFGSLGRPIAQNLAALLDINYYDRYLVDEAAKQLNLPVSTIVKSEESKKSKFFSMQFPLGLETEEKRDRIFAVQKDIILNIADRESCIIVGRCADYILRNVKRHISIHIYAPYENRLQNCVDTLGMSISSAKKMIADVDEARVAFHKHYAKYRPDDVREKDILLNSSLLGAQGTAEFLSTLVKKKFYDTALPEGNGTSIL